MTCDTTDTYTFNVPTTIFLIKIQSTKKTSNLKKSMFQPKRNVELLKSSSSQTETNQFYRFKVF